MKACTGKMTLAARPQALASRPQVLIGGKTPSVGGKIPSAETYAVGYVVLWLRKTTCQHTPFLYRRLVTAQQNTHLYRRWRYARAPLSGVVACHSGPLLPGDGYEIWIADIFHGHFTFSCLLSAFPHGLGVSPEDFFLFSMIACDASNPRPSGWAARCPFFSWSFASCWPYWLAFSPLFFFRFC